MIFGHVGHVPEDCPKRMKDGSDKCRRIRMQGCSDGDSNGKRQVTLTYTDGHVLREMRTKIRTSVRLGRHVRFNTTNVENTLHHLMN